MGAMAKGKINASEARIGDRIIVKVYEASRDEDQVALSWVSEQKGEVVTRAIGPSRTKTGAGVVVTTITGKAKVANRRGYWITTGEGEFYGEPIQTMWSAPEDAAGIKRAHAEALVEDVRREVEAEVMDKYHAEALAEDEERTEKARRLELAAHVARRSGRVDARPTRFPGIYVQMVGQAPESERVLDLLPPLAAGKELVRVADLKPLTLDSHDGKVDNMNNDASATQTEVPAADRETTGSAVVRLMERVHARIRQNHPEVPAVVIVTGAGIGPLGGKWGHFRPQGWTAEDEGNRSHIHEMFMAGETLAKGGRQVLQTMLHESAHALAETRGKQDTSRQGRWHNKVFLATAEEMGLEYRKDKANPQIGYSEVVLKDETVDEYRDLLDALDAEIHLMVSLPGWLRTGKDGDDDEPQGGENMPRAPKGPATPNTNNIKCVCRCEEPNIIRMSRKVLDQAVVNCGDCDSLFTAA